MHRRRYLLDQLVRLHQRKNKKTRQSIVGSIEIKILAEICLGRLSAGSGGLVERGIEYRTRVACQLLLLVSNHDTWERCTMEGEHVSRKKQKLEKYDIDPVVKRQAEIEMGRVLKDEVVGHSTQPGYEIGRYDYDMVNRMTEGVSGYLVRCDMNRERSSIKEFATMLQQIDTPNDSDDEPKSRFNVVKLDARGIIMLALNSAGGQRDACHEVIKNVKKLYHGIESGSVKAPRFCHRVVPVVTTCKFEEKDIREASRGLVEISLGCDEGFRDSSSFAVAYSSRKSKQHDDGPGRQKAIAALAQGFSEEFEKYMLDNGTPRKATVDLSFPSAVLNLEQLNVMGRQYAALGVTPGSLCSKTPKLIIKSLQKIHLSNDI